MPRNKIVFPAELLRSLHRLHRNKTELTSQLDRGPRKVKAGAAMVNKAQQDADAAKEALKQAKLASDDKQLQLKSREDRIEDLKAKLNTAASNREFDTLKEQIAADQQANSVLSDEIFEGLERLDVLDAELKAAEEELAKQQAEQKQRVTETEQRMVVVHADLEHVIAELAKAETAIPSEAKANYERLTNSKGEEALAPIDDYSCGGCNQTLTTQVVDKLQLSILVNCPNCNAFLYIPEQTSVG